MNGATAVELSTTKAPTSTSTAISGNSHHFLFSRRNAHTSPARLPDFREAIRSKLFGSMAPTLGLPEVPLDAGVRIVLDPVALRGRVHLPPHGVVPEGPHHQPDRSEDDVKDQPEDDVREHESDGEGRVDPAQIDPSPQGRHREI